MHCIIDSDSLLWAAASAPIRKHWRVERLDGKVAVNGSSHRACAKWIRDNIPEEQQCEFTLEFDQEDLGVDVAYGTLYNKVSNIARWSGCNTWNMFLSDPNDDWRRRFSELVGLKPYKCSRDGRSKPLYWKEIWQEATTKYDARVATDGDEADDTCSRIMYNAWDNGDIHGVMVAHIDKDLDQIPGWHYNWDHNKTYFLTREQAIRNFYVQVLAGDRTDDVDGLKGIGVPKAQKILKDVPNEPVPLLEACIKAYTDHCNPNMYETAKLLWLHRHHDQVWSPHLIRELYYG